MPTCFAPLAKSVCTICYIYWPTHFICQCETFERAILNRKISKEMLNMYIKLNYRILTKLTVKPSFFWRWEGGKQILYFRIRLSSKRPNWQNCNCIFDSTTRQYKAYGIFNNNTLFAWKYQVNFDAVIWNERSINICIFEWSAKMGGWDGIKS